tara:strand:- start:942 stop:1409 length:468 start_codon:yes stop_codon:yes gene_type:complete
MNNLSEHVSYKEATKSVTANRLGIENTPDEDIIATMKVTCKCVFEPIREHFNQPIYISSFYRSPELNTAIGGSKKSQHCKGEAIDIDDVYGDTKNSQIFEYIKDRLDFDQLIWEFGDDQNPSWVHVSYRLGNNRRRVLKAYKSQGRTRYIDITNN